jgi:hypothetical protein
MALKRSFNDDEKIGMTQQEIEIGEKYLRANKTAGAVSQLESLKLFEMYMVGCSFHEIHQQFPSYDVGQIILTAALQRWGMDRDKMQSSLRDRVRSKVIKSVIEQTDFLTAMLSVASTEYIDQMRKYIVDPDGNAPPSLRIKSIKDYKEVTDTLAKIVQGATPNAKDNKVSPMFDALAPTPIPDNEKRQRIVEEEEPNLDDILANTTPGKAVSGD